MHKKQHKRRTSIISAGFAPSIPAIERPQTYALNDRIDGIGRKSLVLYYSIILQTMKRRNANCIGHILRRNCLLKQRYIRDESGKSRSDGRKRKKT
jgi:hypothetical protein